MSRKTTNTHPVFAIAALGIGMASWTIAGNKLAGGEQNAFNYTPNILDINGSPLGKTLALALQSDIDLHWHEGKSNPYELHDHSGCDHEHGDCEHEHHDHGDCDHGDCDHEEHAGHDHSPPAGQESPKEQSLVAGWKSGIDSLTRRIYQSDSPFILTERHRRNIREGVKKKIEFAYRLDPENYFNYNTLHLFYETNLGNDPKSAEELITLAIETRKSIRHYTVDPEPWLTAAATQQNICYVLSNYYKLTGHEEEFITHVNDMRACLIHFDRLRQHKIQNGSWAKIASPRKDQMMRRFQETLKAHADQLAIFATMNTRGDIGSPLPPLTLQSSLTIQSE